MLVAVNNQAFSFSFFDYSTLYVLTFKRNSAPETRDFAKTLLGKFQFIIYLATIHVRRRKQSEPISRYSGIEISTILGRMCTVRPSNVERYNLRTLLHRVREPSSYYIILK